MAQGPMAEPRWLTSDEQRAWRGYRRMRALLDLEIARDLGRDSDLSDSDYDVLSTLTEGELGASADDSPAAWRATALADRLLWSTSRLAHHVGRMERRGLVGRGTCGDDGRGSTVFLTARGRQVLEDAAPLHVESVRRHLIDVLTAEEIDQLAAITSKVLDRLAADG